MGFRKVKKKDSFGQWYLDTFGEEKLEELLNNPKNNNLRDKIFNISTGSEYHIWFKCEKKDYHENCMSAHSFFSGGRCKYCGRTKYVHPKDSLGQYIIDNYGEDFLKIIWSDKNKESAFKYSIGTEKKVWFKCPDGIHEDSYRQVKNAVNYNFRCPYCSSKCNYSILQEKVYEYVKDKFKEIRREHNCTIVPVNPKTKFKMPFDVEIVDYKLIIEINGKQHYECIGKNSKWLHGLTPEEYLKERKEKDEYKKNFAIKNGYHYLEIPYWCDDDKETWKKMIDEKINKINEGTTTETYQLNP